MDPNRREQKELGRSLADAVQGDVRFTEADRALYATDASIYQVKPLGAFLPQDQADAIAGARHCLREGAPILPRGGGTSLAGQTVAKAVVFDCTRHLRAIRKLDLEERRAWVEPGLIQSHLNQALAPHGLMFGPDTASANRASLGGMIGNNSSGSHSILFGKTVDAVRGLKVLLSDGSTPWLSLLPWDEVQGLSQLETTLGRVAKTCLDLRARLLPSIQERFPKVMRRVSGYNLDVLLDPEGLDLGKLVVGSEGSLGLVLEAEVDLVPAPKRKGVALVHFRDLEPAIAATVPLLETQPSAVELMDEMLLDLAAANPSFRTKLWFMKPETQALQLVEYFAESEGELEDCFGRLKSKVQGLDGAIGLTIAENALQVHDAWAIRKAGLPLLSSIPSDRKPLPFVEDTAVDPEKLPGFVARFKEIVESHGTQAAYYAHASAGCLHIRPLLDLHDVEDQARLTAISEEVFQLVLDHGGSMSGEHGDGRARSHYNQRLFGEEIYQGFRELKAAFDPEGLFNPGQVVDAPAMDQDLRVRYSELKNPKTHLDFTGERGFRAALEACNGTGACRKVGEGTMCPSFQATRDEAQSTRGRANLLRNAFLGGLPPEELFSKEIEGALELCLMCKACKSECPVQVDLSKLKTEWLAQKRSTQGSSLQELAFSRFREFSDLARRTGLAPRALDFPGVEAASRLLLGLSGSRPLPRMCENDFFTQRKSEGQAPRALPKEELPFRGKKVRLFVDSFSLHYDPTPALDATASLEAWGFEVEIPKLGCCGRAALGQGDVDRARGYLRALAKTLKELAQDEVPWVGVEPGCLSMLWDDAKSLLDPEAAELLGRIRSFEDFAGECLRDPQAKSTLKRVELSVQALPHCHFDALGHRPKLEAFLQAIPGVLVEETSSGCCGMAGDFGYRHPELSAKIWSQHAASSSEFPLVIQGWSCRQQAKHQGPREGIHPASILAQALGVGSGARSA